MIPWAFLGGPWIPGGLASWPAPGNGFLRDIIPPLLARRGGTVVHDREAVSRRTLARRKWRRLFPAGHGSEYSNWIPLAADGPGVFAGFPAGPRITSCLIAACPSAQPSPAAVI